MGLFDKLKSLVSDDKKDSGTIEIVAPLSGEIVNIDGKCNRVAATLFGPKRCIFVCGVNKLRPDLQSAIERARNIAAPLNAKRLNKKTPCAVDGRCHNCKSPERICRAMVIHMGVPSGFESCEVVLIGEKLGY